MDSNGIQKTLKVETNACDEDPSLDQTDEEAFAEGLT